MHIIIKISIDKIYYYYYKYLNILLQNIKINFFKKQNTKSNIIRFFFPKNILIFKLLMLLTWLDIANLGLNYFLKKFLFDMLID